MSSPQNYQSSAQPGTYTGNPSMKDIEYIQDKLQRTGEAISHTHENTDPDVLRRIELEVKAIGDLIRKHYEEHGVGGSAVGGMGSIDGMGANGYGGYRSGGVDVSGGVDGGAGVSGGYVGGVTFGDGGVDGGVGVSGGYGGMVTFDDGGVDGAGVSGGYGNGVTFGDGGVDVGTSTFKSEGGDNMKLLQLQMEKQELEMKLNMAKEAMNDYVSRLSEKVCGTQTNTKTLTVGNGNNNKQNKPQRAFKIIYPDISHSYASALLLANEKSLKNRREPLSQKNVPHEKQRSTSIGISGVKTSRLPHSTIT